MFNKGKCVWKRMNWGLTCCGAALKKMTRGSLGQMTQSSFRCPFWVFQVKNKTRVRKWMGHQEMKELMHVL